MHHTPWGPSLLVLFATLTPALAQREYGFDNTKPSGQPYLSPQESLRRMKVADGWEVKLFAAEPQVINPIAFTIDERGRVWVVESYEYPKRTPKGKMPRDRIIILEDTDGDGVCDKRTVFAEGKDFPVPFDLASGIEVGNGGVYLGAPPYLFFIENKNDKPGKFEILLKGFGSQDTHEMLNTFQWGPDGWLYGLQGVFTNSHVIPGEPGASAPGVELTAGVWRFDPRTHKFEVFAEGTSNPWGMDWRNTDGQFILCCCVIPHLFHMVPGGIYKRQAGQSRNPYAYSYLKEICDHTFHKESGWAHAGLISLDVPHVPKQYRNSVIFGSIHGCSIKQNVLRRNGSTYIASRGDDFLVSGDKNFRPINLRWGPNGDIFVSDWHDQNPCHQAKPDSWDYEHGRIFRLQVKGTKLKKAEDLSKKSTGELVALVLGDKGPWWQRTALRLLHERERRHEIPLEEGRQYARKLQELIRAARPASNPLLALYVASLFAPQVKMLTVDNPVIREWAIREVSEDLPGADCVQALAPLAQREADSRVRRAMACAALKHAPDVDVLPLLRALTAHTDDVKDPVIPQIVWLALEKRLSAEPQKPLGWLKQTATGNEFVTSFLVPRTMRRLVATGKPADLAACVAFLADVKDMAVRRQALDGLVTALRGRLVDAPPNWKATRDELLASKSPDVTQMVGRLAVSFRDLDAARAALAVARDTTRTATDRAQALRDLALARLPEALPVLLQLAESAGPADVRAEAVRALAGYNSPAVPRGLIAAWPKLTPALRGEAVSVLSTRKTWAKELLAAVGTKAVARTDLTDNTILRMRAFRDRSINDQIEKVWGRVRETPAELNALIDRMRRELSAGPASFERGRAVFEQQCAKCHKFEGHGHEVGPPLDGAARDIEYILANVLDPNRVVGAPYFQRIVEMKDGRVETGLLAGEDAQTITLKGENDALKVISRKDVESVVVSEKSVMPEGLTKNMTVQNFRDLVRYLMVNPFLAQVTVDGLPPRVVGVPGRIGLPASTSDAGFIIRAEVTAPAVLRTRLLLGANRDLVVTLNGREVYKGRPSERGVAPDQTAADVTLQPGVNRLAIHVRFQGEGTAVYARFLDPGRRLRYPELK